MHLINSIAIFILCATMRRVEANNSTDGPSTSGLNPRGDTRESEYFKLSHMGVNAQTRPASFNSTSEAQRRYALELVIELANAFSAKFLDILASEITETCVQSPLLSFLSLSMLFWGTSGSTRTALMECLGFSPHDPQTIHLGLQTLIDDLSQNRSDIELDVNHEMFLPSDISPDPDYIELIREFYRASIDHENSPPPTRTTNAIRTFLTKIRQRLGQDRFSIILRNSIGFRGPWVTEFDASRTRSRPFYVYGNEATDTPTMYAKGMFRYGHLMELESTWIELPYKAEGNGMSLFIIRPDSRHPDVYQQLLKNFGGIDLGDLVKGEKRHVELYLPRLKITTSFLSSEWIPQVFGSKNPFGSEDELSKMLPTTNDLKFKDIYSEVAIAINEREGATSGLTGIYHKARKTRSPENPQPETFDVNIPFVGILATTGPKAIKLLYITVSGSEFRQLKP